MSTSSIEMAPAAEPRAGFAATPFVNPANPEPIRGELYGLEHLEAHARNLAAAFRLAPPDRPGHPLLRRFRQMGRELDASHRHIAGAARQQETLSPDAEWLLDNYHIVAETLREVQHDLPRGYYAQLPKLAGGPFDGLPRVYALALELIAHTDSSLDEANVTRFVQAYQTVAPLTTGELWAVPIMLRLGLLENLCRLACQMRGAWEHRCEAALWKAHLLGLTGPTPQEAAARLGEPRFQPRSQWSDTFVVHLLQALRDHGPKAGFAIECLECHFGQRGIRSHEVVRREHQRQAGNQVTVGNCVTSLRLLSALDWTEFFEKTSRVEAVLREDPAGTYARQDFPTRDRCRRAVERLARGSRHTELDVARHAVALAARAPAGDAAARHVGFYLLGRGQDTLAAEIGYRPRWSDWFRAALLAHPEAFYFGALAVAAVALLTGVAAYAGTAAAGVALVALSVLAALLPASELAVGLVHYLVTLLVLPRVLPKMDFKGGIPEDCTTFVVIPSMLLIPESGDILAEHLEIHYLSNPDPQLRFALLTDFADAPAEHMPGDDEFLRNALDRVKALNERHAAGGPDRFFLLHRRRQWNPVQNCWMGWERKRGKLLEFNRLLRGARDTSYTTISGDLGSLPKVRFVITLDADTKLPRETARRLVATLAHPLNRPRYDAARGRVVAGYGLLQPRVSLGLAGASRSLFARIFSGSVGLDPYTTAVSDVYQDLFGRGSFTGKGIYDVDAFEATVGHTFPDNQILSHDLIEGNYARCGLVTDIELLDDFPARYHAYARREHRWARGDWQILPWLFRRVPAAPNGQRPNPLPILERWKILDNLRRSLVPPALVVLLLLGWTVLPGSPWFWTAFALAVPALPLLLLLLGSAVNLLRYGGWHLQLQALREPLADTAGQAVLSVIFLADQARGMVDAVVRTLVRLFVTRKNLLEWETAASTERRLGTGFVFFFSTMGGTSLTALVAAVVVALVRPESLAAAVPILAAWLISPAVAFWVSQPLPVRREPDLTPDDRQALRRVARKTWAFFETFVGPEGHHLPPDNYQEDPKGEVALRTSPTNIGLYLLSSLAAHDFGYLSLPALLDRLEATFATLEQLERSHGHFYNWYDTRTLRALQPLYLSTVDSGNLLACLLALKQGLREKLEEPIPAESAREGLSDTLALAAEALRAVEPAGPEPVAAFGVLDGAIRDSRRLLEQTPADRVDWHRRLERLHHTAQAMPEAANRLGGELGEKPEDLLRWVGAFAHQVAERRDELAGLAPWLALTAGAAEAKLPPQLRQRLATPAGVAEFQDQADAAVAELAGLGEEAAAALRKAVLDSSAPELLARCQSLADRASALAGAMDFKVLYNEPRHLFSIGYNLSLNRLDNSHYDLLASEASLTSFLAIARGDAPRRHWFQLGRPLTAVPGGIALVSWGGTMFEYLMPRLLLRGHPGTLADASQHGAVARQIEYGWQSRVPWGISESGFSALDARLDYQYQSFGVPGLGLKRGLAKDLVVAPYATALALAIRPREAVANFRALAAERADGPYGFYEAVDYTRDRLREKRRSAVVRSFMAHHQGMSLVALANCLLGDPMPRRFHAEPMVRATELLLDERVPPVAPLVQPHGDEAVPNPVVRDHLLPVSRRLTTPDTPHPRVHLLSNRQYSVMITNAGAGSSTCRDMDVTRWREDRTCDAWGQFCYVRDLRSGLLWSAGHQPVGRVPDLYEVVYSTDKAEFRRIDGGIETHWEITVSPENNAEVRRLTLTNHTPKPHDLEVTSYAEVVLAPHRADAAHPAFAKLFLETEFIASEDALLCRRRPRSSDQKAVWAVHVAAVDGPVLGDLQYETDRARFLGRGRTPANPAVLEPGAVLSGTTGAVLDPVFSLRRRVRLAPGTSLSLAFTTAAAESREEALALADQYHDVHGVNRAFELAWAHTQVELRHLSLSAEEAHLYQRLAGHVFYAGPALRAAGAVAANTQGQPGLWRHGISGDRPIVLARIAEAEELGLARQLLLAHTYWRLKGLEVDLVLLNEHPASYLEELHQQLQNLIRASDAHALADKPGGVFLRQAAHLSEDDKVLLQAAARAVLAGNRGSLAAQVDRLEAAPELPPALVPTEQPGRAPRELPSGNHKKEELLFDNGLGGFTPDGREYVIRLAAREEKPAAGRRGRRPGRPELPPAPWVNVVANPNFGFFVSESGGGYTWAGNSQANRLTPWTNDPVSDPPGEVVYLRDEATGEYWTPTPFPLGRNTVVRHGQGYTRFVQESQGLAQELLVFVPPDDPVKLIRLKVRNVGPRPRRLSAAFFAEWVLGSWREQAASQVVSSLDPESGALLARNAWANDFANRVAFADVSARPRTLTADRTEFLGRNGSVAAPAALGRVELSGRTGPLLDPCAALMARLDLAPGEEKEVVFLLGQAGTVDEARQLLRRYREPGRVQAALDEARAGWDRLLGAVQVRTPDPALDLLLNRWLLYQVLSCRVWGRSAFYQSGGAYGFRDQLQDVMALVYGAPQEARAQILRAAGRQFLEGDVQHWWHPPAGRGVRTRISDDLLWLPFVVCHYVATTGDAAVLDEQAPFLRGPVLKPDQEEDYGLPEVTQQTAPVYEHCVRAIEHASRFGAHGLPLMGTGDWNDGMNKVGAGGKGESVWDGWFLLTILNRFAGLAEAHGDTDRARAYRERAEQLSTALEEHAWDGRWYRRAYFDDGTPLGSQQNDECKIDSIAETWAVIAGVADPGRAQQAMAAVEEFLVKDADRMILLFTPPFDAGSLHPGYIKGYLPGIRENGGQYTHAATWVVQATALLGRGNRAAELFDLLNPIRHASSPADVAKYKVEPYVVVADIYSLPPHTGRGGWTWYTGSAGWLYRVALEDMLGFRLEGNRLRLEPCIPARWSGFQLTFRYRTATYQVTVENPHGVEHGRPQVSVDGRSVAGDALELADDGATHEVRVVLGQ
jgi:cyclic beta-1,2-glucan synthetase